MKKFILILSLILAGCGGGGSSTVSTIQPVPSKPVCSLDVNSNTVPQSYYGTNSIPTPLSKFDNSIQRGIGLKDYHPVFTIPNCTKDEYSRLLYQRTLDRLQLLNVDFVEVYQYGPVVDFNAAIWTVDKSSWQIPESELIWFIKEANSRNIKVNIVWQLWPVDTKGNKINPDNNMTEAEMLKVLRGWHNIIVELAKFGGNNGLNILTVHWNAFYFPVTSRYKESATTEFLSIINDVRQYFNGKLFMEAVPLFFDRRIIDKVDGIIVPLTPSNWTRNDDSNISVDLLKRRYLDKIFGIALEFSISTGLELKSIPIIWDFNIQSRDRALSEGWVEDGFCVSSIVNGAPVSYNNPLCMQKNYVTDFSIQALAIEGAFQAIKEQTLIKTYGIIFSTSYWHTDTLVPGEEGFPNLSQSIRGKPAENIVKHWFSKI